MIDKEMYKREIVRMWDSMRDGKYKGQYECSGVPCCERCALNDIDCGSSTNAFEMIEIVEKWSKEHPPKKYKLSALENDIIFTVLDFGTGDEKFSNYKLLTKLLKDGYFEGAKPSDKIADYIENCEVKEDV